MKAVQIILILNLLVSFVFILKIMMGNKEVNKSVNTLFDKI